MATVKRMESSESFERTSLPVRATIRYLVLGAYKANAAVEAVQNDPDGIALGDAHPDAIAGDRLQATRFRVSERVAAGEDRSWFVDVEFGIDGSGANFEEPPTSEPDYSTVEFSTVDKDFKAPYWIREPQVGVSPSGTLTTTYKWEERFSEFQITGLQLRVVVNVNADEYKLSNWVANQAQVNRIHTIGGSTKWQYLGASSSQVAVDVWQVTHEWWADPGNGPIPIPDGANPSQTITYTQDRLPFEDYQSYKIPAGVGIPGVGPVWVPVVSIYEPFVEEANGFTNLVGYPFEADSVPGGGI